MESMDDYKEELEASLKKIRVGDVVNRAGKIAVIKSSHTGAFGPHVRVVVNPVKEVGHTGAFFDGSKKSAHVLYTVLICLKWC